jgi:hypothetical protein
MTRVGQSRVKKKFMAYHSAELSVLGEFALVPAAAAEANVEGAIVRNGVRRVGTEKERISTAGITATVQMIF